MSWNELPELVLAKIFNYLDVIDKIQAGKTCSTWHRALQNPEIWFEFTYSENDIWERLFPTGIPCTTEDIEYYDKVSQEIQNLVERNIKYCRHVTISLRGIHSFAIFIEICDQCSNLTHLTLFQLVSQSSSENLKQLTPLLDRNKRLHHLRVEDLSKFGDKNSPVPMGLIHGKTLSSLWIVNSFNSNSLSNVMYLVNLKKLVISPRHLNFSLLKHLASHALTELHVVANSKTREFYNEALSDFHWKEICKCGPMLRVYCFLAVSHEWAQKDIFLKQSMPLVSLVYRKNVWLKYVGSIARMMEQHRDTLEEFVDFALTEGPYRHPRSHDYQDRIDKHTLHIVRSCPKLKTLIIKEILSSSTLLLMAYLNRGLSGLVIREDMVLYDNDLPSEEIEHTREIQTMLEENWTKEKFSTTMSSLLGMPWTPLSVEDYKDFLSRRYANYT